MLGVNTDQTLSSHSHMIGTKKRCCDGLMECPNFYCVVKKLVLESLSLCHLDNFSAVWFGALRKDLNELQKIQNKTIR